MGVVDELEEGICLVYFLVYPMIFHRTNAGHRWKIGYKDVSFPNQRRIKDESKTFTNGFVPALKRLCTEVDSCLLPYFNSIILKKVPILTFCQSCFWRVLMKIIEK